MDFSHEDLVDAIDHAVRELLTRAGVNHPPVDALELAQVHFRLAVVMAELEEEEPRRYGAPPKRRPDPNAIVLKMEQSEEAHQTLAGRAVAKQLLPGILAKLGIAPGTENRGADKQLMGAILPRLLLPTRLFAPQARRSGYDLFDLKSVFTTATYEAIA